MILQNYQAQEVSWKSRFRTWITWKLKEMFFKLQHICLDLYWSQQKFKKVPFFLSIYWSQQLSFHPPVQGPSLPLLASCPNPICFASGVWPISFLILRYKRVLKKIVCSLCELPLPQSFFLSLQGGCCLFPNKKINFTLLAKQGPSLHLENFIMASPLSKAYSFTRHFLINHPYKLLLSHSCIRVKYPLLRSLLLMTQSQQL